LDEGKVAEKVFRDYYVPNYPLNTPISDMTPYEQGLYKQTLRLAHAITLAYKEGRLG